MGVSMTGCASGDVTAPSETGPVGAPASADRGVPSLEQAERSRTVARSRIGRKPRTGTGVGQPGPVPGAVRGRRIRGGCGPGTVPSPRQAPDAVWRLHTRAHARAYTRPTQP